MPKPSKMELSNQFIFATKQVKSDVVKVNESVFEMLSSCLSVDCDDVLSDELCLNFLSYGVGSPKVIGSFEESSLLILNEFRKNLFEIEGFRYKDELYRMHIYKLFSYIFPKTWFCHTGNLTFSKELVEFIGVDLNEQYMWTEIKEMPLAEVSIELIDEINVNIQRNILLNKSPEALFENMYFSYVVKAFHECGEGNIGLYRFCYK